MKTLLRIVSFSCAIATTGQIVHAASEPERQMGVRAGPEQVFSRPVAEIVPQLQGATPTNRNGRVGSELVFWGYRLSNGVETNLFACAMLDGVECDTRALRICPDRNAEIEPRITESGNIVKRMCQPVGQAAVGDLHPGCTNNEIQNDLLVGLASCPGS